MTRAATMCVALLLAGTATGWERPAIEAADAAQRVHDEARTAAARAALATALAQLSTASAGASNDAARRIELERRRDELSERVERQRAALVARQADVGDLYTAARQSAGDLVATLHEMQTAPPSPVLETRLRALAASPRALGLDELAELWESMHVVLTHTATLERTTRPVQTTLAELRDHDVLRIGTRLAYAGSSPLRYDHVSGVYRLADASGGVAARQASGVVALPVLGGDHTAAASPGRLAHAGPVGALILALGGIGGVLLLLRALRVLLIARAERLGQPDSPIARLAIARDLHGDERGESLAGWLNTAVRREVRRLAWGHAALKVIIAAAPLLGLLGTVTGMIVMFEQLRLYGGGDPVLMADGISQALETTWLGLVVALPLLLGQRALLTVANGIVRRLDREAVALVAAASPAS